MIGFSDPFRQGPEPRSVISAGLLGVALQPAGKKEEFNSDKEKPESECYTNHCTTSIGKQDPWTDDVLPNII